MRPVFRMIEQNCVRPTAAGGKKSALNKENSNNSSSFINGLLLDKLTKPAGIQQPIN